LSITAIFLHLAGVGWVGGAVRWQQPAAAPPQGPMGWVGWRRLLSNRLGRLGRWIESIDSLLLCCCCVLLAAAIHHHTTPTHIPIHPSIHPHNLNRFSRSIDALTRRIEAAGGRRASRSINQSRQTPARQLLLLLLPCVDWGCILCGCESK